MKNKQLDPGLEYLRLLNIRASKTATGAFDNLEKIIGREKTSKLRKMVDDRANDTGLASAKNQQEFYDFKNENYDAAISFTGSFDGDIIRNTCNWIAEHPDLFGETILDIGCDTGLLSCFIAKQFPDSKITAIDKYENGPKVGQNLAEKLGLSNIEFRCVSAENLGEKFDTVLSSRTMHENHSADENWTLMYKQQARAFRDSLNEYAGLLATLLKDGGNLISIERCGKNPLLLGWLWALGANKLALNYGMFSEINAQECTKQSVFEVCPCKKIADLISEEEVYSIYPKLANCNVPADFAWLSNWNAALTLQDRADEMILGYIAIDNSQNAFHFSQTSLWTNKTDPTSLLFFTSRADTGEQSLENYDNREDLFEEIKKRMTDYNRSLYFNGYEVHSIDYIDGNIVTGPLMYKS